MEKAHQCLILGDLKEAIASYSHLIEAESTNPDLFLCRAVAYTELAQYELAIKDLEKAEKFMVNNFQVSWRWGVALFYVGNFVDSLTKLKVAEALAKAEHEKVAVSKWIQKCLREQGNMSAAALNATARMPQPPDAPLAAPAEEPKPAEGIASISHEKKLDYDWYQTETHVIMNLKTKSFDKSKVEVTFEANELSVVVKLEEGNFYECSYTLSGEVDASQCARANKSIPAIELKLKKKVDHIQWKTLEKAETKEEARPAYPTSAKKKVNWDKLDKQIEKEMAQEKPEGDEALNSLLKAIYEKGDENTRRAMIKSMQTSDGTVLSTNWNDVEQKDYQGKDRPEPPKGQEWRKPEM